MVWQVEANQAQDSELDEKPVQAGGFLGATEVLGREAVQEVLDAHGISDELVEIWTEREERVLFEGPPPVDVQQGGLAPDVRSVALWFMAHLVKVMCLPEKSWFDVVLLLDVYCLRAPSPVRVTDLPALCGALARLLKKVDMVGYLTNEYELLMHTMRLAQYLRQAGHTVEDTAVTAEKLGELEENVLQVLRWRINLPCVDSWMSLFCARMNTLTRQSLFKPLASIWQQSQCFARTMLLQRATCLRFSPRHLVQGLLGIGFVAVRMLPPEALGLEGSDELEGLFFQQPSEGMPPLQEMPLGHQKFLLELLQVATGSSLDALKSDCKLVQDEMRKSSICKKTRLHHSTI